MFVFFHAEIDDAFERDLLRAADEACAAIPEYCAEATFKKPLGVRLLDSSREAFGRAISRTEARVYISKGAYARTVEVKKGKADPKHETQARAYTRLAGNSVGFLLNVAKDGAVITRVRT